ncbi:hypothetical protein [Hellea balneolensis]|uniref:hypothetical protein n=1 Tax=Hellea balneolensis TaxID=287478 RepID=UPI0004199BCF|nr:hypothetical protein [Hellea balneolensis]
MARYQVRPREDGRGPYRWSHVVKTRGNLRQGSIYRQMGDELDAADAAQLVTLCDKSGFDMRRVA